MPTARRAHLQLQIAQRLQSRSPPSNQEFWGGVPMPSVSSTQEEEEEGTEDPDYR